MSLLEATQEGKVGRLCAKSAERTPHGESFEAMTDGVLSLKRKLLRVRPRGVFATLGRSRWVKRPPCSGCSPSPRSSVRSVSARKPTFSSAVGTAMSVSDATYSRQSRCCGAVRLLNGRSVVPRRAQIDPSATFAPPIPSSRVGRMDTVWWAHAAARCLISYHADASVDASAPTQRESRGPRSVCCRNAREQQGADCCGSWAPDCAPAMSAITFRACAT